MALALGFAVGVFGFGMAVSVSRKCADGAVLVWSCYTGKREVLDPARAKLKPICCPGYDPRRPTEHPWDLVTRTSGEPFGAPRVF